MYSSMYVPCNVVMSTIYIHSSTAMAFAIAARCCRGCSYYTSRSVPGPAVSSSDTTKKHYYFLECGVSYGDVEP
nr:hypothetical protein Itr_chr04CG11640 [Ipomoea trifida]